MSGERPKIRGRDYCSCGKLKWHGTKMCRSCYLADPRMEVHRPTIIQPSNSAIRHIALTQNQIAIVDADDYERLMEFNWHASFVPTSTGGNFYAHRAKPVRQLVTMQNEVLRLPKGILVDHKNHNTLDNRKENLRPATISQNNANRRCSPASGYKGVARTSDGYSWKATIRDHGKSMHLGRFKTAEEAYAVYKAKAIELYGEFACV